MPELTKAYKYADVRNIFYITFDTNFFESRIFYKIFNSLSPFFKNKFLPSWFEKMRLNKTKFTMKVYWLV